MCMKCIIIIPLLFLVSCGDYNLDRQYRKALKRLDLVDQELLLKDVEGIISSEENIKNVNLPRDKWTSEILKMNPAWVRCYDDSVSILIERWGSSESGFQVRPAGVNVYEGDFPERRVSDKIKWYAL